MCSEPRKYNDVDLAGWAGRVQSARQRVYAVAQVTPISKTCIPGHPNTHILLKREDLQATGSFKLRGATNKVLTLSPEEAARGVITSSTGNHGLGLAAAARFRRIDAEVFVSRQVSQKKLDRIRQFGASIHQVGDHPLEAELAARSESEAKGKTYISPYNDTDVVAGQGTIAAELLEQLPHIDTVYVAVGGGGLISGMGAFLKHNSPNAEIVGCWPENSRVMYECLRAGEIVEFPEEPTLSESTAGGVEPGSITFELCRRVIDRTLLVSEQQILDAVRWARNLGWQFEGATGVAIAAAFRDSELIRDSVAVVIACGANLSPEAERVVEQARS